MNVLQTFSRVRARSDHLTILETASNHLICVTLSQLSMIDGGLISFQFQDTLLLARLSTRKRFNYKEINFLVQFGGTIRLARRSCRKVNLSYIMNDERCIVCLLQHRAAFELRQQRGEKKTRV